MENQITKDDPKESIDTKENILYSFDLGIPYLYIPSFSEPVRKTPGRPRSERSYITQQHKPKPKNPEEAKFLVDLPVAHNLIDENGEKWTLRCVCNNLTDRGLLVYCENCGTWQHAICFNLNNHTTPEKYLCEICGNRPIRCTCEENLNYRFSLIQCTSCGYYAHKRCVGLLYGPLPSGNFICSYCGGKSKFTYPKIKLQQNITEENPVFTFSQENIDKTLNPRILTGPFKDFLLIDVFDSTLTRKEFFEALFDRFRSFFFLCHPLFSTTIHKKRRQNLVQSVLNASTYLAKKLYNTDHSLFVRYIDALLVAAIYKEPTFVDDPDETELSFSENARFEYQSNPPPQSFPQMPNAQPLKLSDSDEVICSNTLTQGQFLMCVDGLLGDLEEFNYDDKVDSAYYQLFGTRFVLDATRFKGSFIHSFKRSMYGNCVIKLFTVLGKVHCGVFVGRAQLEPYDPSDVLTIHPGEPLKLGIDFLPAVCEDYTAWFSWHCGDLEREGQSPQRQSESKDVMPEKVAKKKIKEEDKRKHQYKLKKKRLDSMPIPKALEPLSLFELFEADDAGTLLFRVGNNLSQIEQDSKIRIVQQQSHGQRGRPRIYPKVTRASSTPITKTPTKKTAAQENDSEESENEEEEKNNSDDEEKKNSEKEDEYMEKEEEQKPTPKKKRGRKPKPKIIDEEKEETHEDDEKSSKEKTDNEETKDETIPQEQEEKQTKEEENKNEVIKEEKEESTKEDKGENNEPEITPKEEKSDNKEAEENAETPEIPKTKELTIFAEDFQNYILGKAKKIHYIPINISDPQQAMKDLLGFV